MNEVKIITMTESELTTLLDRVCRKAIIDAFEQKDDELLNIAELCERIPGLTRHIFKNLVSRAKLKNTQGKYSFKDVKAAMQSH